MWWRKKESLASTWETALVVFAITRNVMVSLSGFSVMALLGFGGLNPLRRRRNPVQDERDEVIQRQAFTAGYTALWLFLVVWGVAVALAFAKEGSVPMVYVAPVIWVGWWLVASVRSITILVLDSRGS